MTTIHDLLLEAGVRPLRGNTFWKAGEHKTLCPRCSHNRKKSNDPCLSVTVTQEAGDTRAVWLCHHCGWTDWAGTGAFARVRKAEKVYRRPTISVTPPQPTVLDWLAGRGIPDWVVRQEQVFGARAWMPQSQAPDHREAVVCFPYFRDGELVNVKYREPVNKWFRQEKDAEPVPYGLDGIRGAKTIYIVEGEIDRLSMLAVGFATTISVPDGAPNKPLAPDSPKMAWVAACWADLEAAERVVIATDADHQGRTLAQELIRRVGAEKAWLVEWPEVNGAQVNDANALLMAAGPEELQRVVDAARPVPTEGEVTVSDAWEAVEALHAGGMVEWRSTGFPSLDPIYRVLRKQITVVTGYAHEGKSSFMDQVMVNMALANDPWRFAIFSPETPVERHIVNLLEKAARTPFFEGPKPRMPLPVARSYRAWMQEHFHFLRFDRQPGSKARPTLEWLIGKLEYMVRRYGIDGVVIDPYNRVLPTKGYERETEFVLDLLDELQAFARRNTCHVWIVAHPAKMLRGKDGKRPDKLTLHDVSGSSHWENCTDMGLLVRRVWQNPVTDQPFHPRKTPTAVEVLKARDKHSGMKGGTVEFRMRFRDGVYLPLTDHEGLSLPEADYGDDDID